MLQEEKRKEVIKHFKELEEEKRRKFEEENDPEF